MNEVKNYNLFDELCGKELSAVTFVRDYLQLSFDGLVLNIMNPLTVESDGIEIRIEDIGFRDILCSQINKIVEKVSCEENKEVVIQFKDNTRILISLREEDYLSPEAITAHGFKSAQFIVI